MSSLRGAVFFLNPTLCPLLYSRTFLCANFVISEEDTHPCTWIMKDNTPWNGLGYRIYLMAVSKRKPYEVKQLVRICGTPTRTAANEEMSQIEWEANTSTCDGKNSQIIDIRCFSPLFNHSLSLANEVAKCPIRICVLESFGDTRRIKPWLRDSPVRRPFRCSFSSTIGRQVTTVPCSISDGTSMWQEQSLSKGASVWPARLIWRRLQLQ